MENKLEKQIEQLEDLAEEINDAAYWMYVDGNIDATDHSWFCERVRNLIDIARELKKESNTPVVLEIKDGRTPKEIYDAMRMSTMIIK